MIAGEKKLDPTILESNVLELIETTKAKIASLTDEISVLQTSVSQINGICQKVDAEISANGTTLSELNEKIRVAQSREETLLQTREARLRDLQQKKVELAQELANTERRNNEIRTKIKKVTEDEKILKEGREIEESTNKKKLAACKRNTAKLEEMAAVKDNEIRKLRAELYKLSTKEDTRLIALENEKRKLLAMFSQSATTAGSPHKQQQQRSPSHP